jgi:hypothetical protein
MGAPLGTIRGAAFRYGPVMVPWSFRHEAILLKWTILSLDVHGIARVAVSDTLLTVPGTG